MSLKRKGDELVSGYPQRAKQGEPLQQVGYPNKCGGEDEPAATRDVEGLIASLDIDPKATGDSTTQPATTRAKSNGFSLRMHGRLVKRATVTSKDNISISVNHNRCFEECSEDTRKKRQKHLAEIQKLLGEASEAWYPPNSRPSKLPLNPWDWSTTILESMRKLAEAVQQPSSQVERLAIVHRYLVAHKHNFATATSQLIHDQTVQPLNEKIDELQEENSRMKQQYEMEVAEQQTQVQELRRQCFEQESVVNTLQARISDMQRSKAAEISARDDKIEELKARRRHVEANLLSASDGGQAGNMNEGGVIKGGEDTLQADAAGSMVEVVHGKENEQLCSPPLSPYVLNVGCSKAANVNLMHS